MKRITITIIILLTTLLVANKSYSQELKNYNLYMQNPILYNPSQAVGNNFLTAYLNSHLQWISFAGAPRTYDAGASMSLTPNMGVGISISESEQGLTNNLNANLKYAYQIKFDKNHFIKMGVSLGITNDRIMSENALYVDVTDVNLSGEYYNRTVFSSGFGLAYKYNAIEAQVIMPQLFEHNKANLYTIGILSYNHKLNSIWNIKPSVMVRGAKATPFQFDGNIAAMWNNQVWGELGYRSNNSFIFGMGFNFNNYSLGYAYQANSDPIAIGNNGTHEIQLIFRLKKKPKNFKTKLFAQVTDSYDNKPINAEITIFDKDIEIGKIMSSSENTNYHIELIQGNTYTFNIKSDGYKSQTKEVIASNGKSKQIENFKLVLEKAVVEGIITSSNNNKPIKAKITILEGNKIISEILSDESGKYSTTLKSGKEYNFNIETENYEIEKANIKINEGIPKLNKDYSLNPFVTISGIVTDSNTGKPLEVSLEIFDNISNKVIKNSKSNIKGEYSIKIKDRENISLTAMAVDYLFYTDNIKIDYSEPNIVKNIKLKPVAIGANVVLNNVNFDLGKHDLRKESFPEINRLISIMTQYKSITVEVSGHTDNTGTEELNKGLSAKRAQAVVDYMVSKGISPSRLKALGLGSSTPRSSNDTETGRQLNRRVEAKILSE